MSNKTLSESGTFLPQEIGKATINVSTESKDGKWDGSLFHFFQLLDIKNK